MRWTLALWAYLVLNAPLLCCAVDLLPYQLVAAGKGCQNLYKNLSTSVGSVQECADLACADVECGQAFEVAMSAGTWACSCMSSGQACIEVHEPSTSRYDIGDMTSCETDIPECFATLFENGDFSGWSGSIPMGDFTSDDFEASGIMDEGASSIFVSGAGCIATVYENADFTGWAASFSEGSYAEEEFIAAGAEDNGVSAITVEHSSGRLPATSMPPPSAETVGGASGEADPVGQAAEEQQNAGGSLLGRLYGSGGATDPPAPPARKRPARPAHRTSGTQPRRGSIGAASLPPIGRMTLPKHWDPHACNVTSRQNCSDVEDAFIKDALERLGHDHTELEHEAQRLKAKHMDVKPVHREWIKSRVQILHSLAAIARNNQTNKTNKTEL